jgi:SAM-dependent methyltransferase
MSHNTASARQKSHYETIHDDYEQHYFDEHSMAYRERFILGPMFEELDLAGKRVADFACGSGHKSMAILRRFPGAQTVGFDISSSAVAAYRRTVGQPAEELDLTAGIAGDASFDAAIIVGGLHHCVSNLSGALETISSFLKPGSPFLIFEPSSEFLLHGLRRVWYRRDRYFDAETEEALSHRELARLAEDLFRVEKVYYMGGPGYFLVLNSLIFRMPHRVKADIARPLMFIDGIYNRLPSEPRLFPYFVARWLKH